MTLEFSGIATSFRFRLFFAILWFGAIVLIAMALIINAELLDTWVRSGLMLIEAAITGLFFLYLIIYVLRPVLKLSREIQEVITGKRGKVEAAASEELNVIANSFNHAMVRLQALEETSDPGPGEVRLPEPTEEPLLEKLERFSLANYFAQHPNAFIEKNRVFTVILQRANALTHAAGSSLLLLEEEHAGHNCAEVCSYGARTPYGPEFRCHLESTVISQFLPAGIN